MIKREYQEPKLVREDRDDKTFEHPSWGLVHVSRCSGLANLFGSSLQHQHYIRLSIGSAQKIVSDNGEERYFGGMRGEMVEIMLSEAQWAQLLSSMNMGGGIPCTLNYLNTEKVPDCPPSTMQDQYHDAVKTETEQLGRELLDLQKTVAARFADKKPLTVKEKEDLLGQINSTVRLLTDKLPFVQSLMQEKLEEQVSAAKVEIDSFIQFKAQLMGFKKISESIASLTESPAKTLGPGSDHE